VAEASQKAFTHGHFNQIVWSPKVRGGRQYSEVGGLEEMLVSLHCENELSACCILLSKDMRMQVYVSHIDLHLVLNRVGSSTQLATRSVIDQAN